MEKKVLLLIIITYLTTAVVYCNTDLPLIAILSTYMDDNNLKASVDARYARWLEASGADSVVFHPWHSEEEIEEVLNKVNGVLIQGGLNEYYMHVYSKQVEIIFTKIMKLQDEKNIRLPLMAISEGLHIISYFITGKNYLTKLSTKNKSIPLKFNPGLDIYVCRLFSLFSTDDKRNFSTLPLSYHNSILGLDPSLIEEDKEFMDFFKITAVGLDDLNKEFVAAVESVEYPIYGLQYHPEVNSFTKNAVQDVNNSIEAIRLSRALGNYFVQEAKVGNKNKMAREEYAYYNYIHPYYNFPTEINENYYFIFTKKSNLK